MHLSHDLDKTLTTLRGTEAFLTVAGAEAAELRSALKLWQDRGFPQTDAIQWALDVLDISQGARSVETEGASSASEDQDPGSIVVLEKCIRGRRSVRKWGSAPVPREIIDRLVLAAMWAPSACNRQSVRYLILEDEDSRAFIGSVRERFLSAAPTAILLFADGANYSPEELDSVPFLDTAMAAQNLLLASHALGLGAVFVKCTPRDLAAVNSGGEGSNLSTFRARFNAPGKYIPVGIIAVGWPAARPQAPPRRRLQEVAFTRQFTIPDEGRTEAGGFERAAKRFARRAFVRTVRAVGHRLGLRVFIATE